MAETTARNIRVPDELWDAAMGKARSEYRTVTDVVVQALRAYVGDGVPAMRPVAELGAQRLESAGTPPPEPDAPAFTVPPKRPRKPVEPPGHVPGAAVFQSAGSEPVVTSEPPVKPSRHPCCKHCKVPHGGHSDPCANGCT